MLKKIAWLGIMLVIFLSLVACNSSDLGTYQVPSKIEKKEINFSIGLINMNVVYLSGHDLQCIINNFSEWKKISDEREYLWELDGKYIEEFFADNSLIVYAFTKGTGGNQIEATEVIVKEDELLVEIDIRLGIMDVMSGGIVVIEVEKSDIQSISSLHIIENLVKNKGDEL